MEEHERANVQRESEWAKNALKLGRGPGGCEEAWRVRQVREVAGRSLSVQKGGVQERAKVQSLSWRGGA
jgi:hypothetical protein